MAQSRVSSFLGSTTTWTFTSDLGISYGLESIGLLVRSDCHGSWSTSLLPCSSITKDPAQRDRSHSYSALHAIRC